MDAVDVLVGVDGFDHTVLVDSIGQGKLHQDAVHPGVFVECVDGAQYLVPGGCGRQARRIAVEPGLLAGPLLVVHIYCRWRIITDENNGKPGCHAMFFLHLDDTGCHFGAYLRCQIGPGENRGCHCQPPSPVLPAKIVSRESQFAALQDSIVWWQI